ncbi:MAG: haloacid dehalogenase [Acidimicrobiales bacterium]|nr:haloacid dehalogenase [Acidimicrobiales bacterium]
MQGGGDRTALRARLAPVVDGIVGQLEEANQAREDALKACRSVIRLSGSAIRSVHRRDLDEADAVIDQAEVALRSAQRALRPFPDLTYAGFLHDAEKEYVEARCTRLLIGSPDAALPGPDGLEVDSRSWLKGIAEAASELRRHLLDRLREGDLARAEQLVGSMEEVYDALVVIDFPDALTLGLRRTVDALRAVLERSRADVTTTAVQHRLIAAMGADG